MVWVRVLVGAVWLNGAIEKLLNPEFPQQFATSLQAGGFVSQAPPFFQDFMRGVVVPNAEIFAQLMRLGAPELLTINVLVALISIVILLSPAAKAFSVDALLAHKSPRLSPLLLNRRV